MQGNMIKNKEKAILRTFSHYAMFFVCTLSLIACYGSNGEKESKKVSGQNNNPNSGGIDPRFGDIDPRSVGTNTSGDSFAKNETTISVVDQSILETNQGTTTFIFIVSLTHGSMFLSSTPEYKVDYTTEDGSALAGQDYLSTSGTLTFKDSENFIQAIEVTVLGDTDFESDETFFLKLSNPQGATLAKAEAIGTIVDDDGPILLPTISVDDQSIAEGDNGEQNLTFHVSMHRTSLDPVSVGFWSIDGTALSSSDYSIVAGILTFAPGEDTKEVQVPVKGDTVVEQNETFHLVLTNPENASINDAVGRATIIDDDTGGSSKSTEELKANDRNVPEGDTGVTKILVDVVLTSPLSVTPIGDLLERTSSQSTAVNSQRSSLEINGNTSVLQNGGASVLIPQNNQFGLSTGGVSLDYTTEDGNARAGADYKATSGSLYFADGEKKKSIEITILGDTLSEGDESFLLRFSNVNGAPMKKTTTKITILDDDSQGSGNDNNKPTISLLQNEGVITEGTHTKSSQLFHVTLDKPHTDAVSFEYFTSDGTAKAGEDYEGISGSIIFTPGETHKFVGVAITADSDEEDDETFSLTLKNPVNGKLGEAKAEATILNDDNAYDATSQALSKIFFKDDFWIEEGHDGTKNAVFSIERHTLNILDSQIVSVDYVTQDGSAEAGKDYEISSGTARFQFGRSITTVSIPIYGDKEEEEEEFFSLKLMNPVNGEVLEDTGVCIIGDDDTPVQSPTLSLKETQVRVLEGDQRVFFQLQLLPGGRLSKYKLGEKNTQGLRFEGDPFALNSQTYGDKVIQFNYETLDGSALAGEDYKSESSSFTIDVLEKIRIAKEEREKLIEEHGLPLLWNPSTGKYESNPKVSIIPKDPFSDLAIEIKLLEDLWQETAEEDFTLKISSPANASISTSQASATIVDDDDGSIVPSDAINAFDFNGDGFNDIVVGAPQTDNRRLRNAGAVHLFLGSSCLSKEKDPSLGGEAANIPVLDSYRADITFLGSTEESQFGFSISASGDLNNDGFDDLVVGAPTSMKNGEEVGTTYVFFGFSPYSSPSFSGVIEAQDADLILNGKQAKAQFGYSVSGGGDFDKDGHDDILISSPYEDDQSLGENVGMARVYSGARITELSKGRSQQVPNDLWGNDHGVYTFSGSGQNARFGTSTSFIGDFNGDNFDDLVIGEPGVGSAYIFTGATDHFSPSSSKNQGAKEAPGLLFYPSGDFGQSICGVGDFDGDGFNDVAVGAPLNLVDGLEAGEVFIFRGRSIDFSTIKTNFQDATKIKVDDGSLAQGRFHNLILGDRNADWSLARTKYSFNNDYDPIFFGKSLASTGDFNNDGKDDLIIGAPKAGFGGFVYIIYGRTKGQNGRSDTKLYGHSGQELGQQVGSLGDVNGDGIDDIFAAGIGGVLHFYQGNSNPSNQLVNTDSDVFIRGSIPGTDFGLGTIR